MRYERVVDDVGGSPKMVIKGEEVDLERDFNSI